VNKVFKIAVCDDDNLTKQFIVESVESYIYQRNLKETFVTGFNALYKFSDIVTTFDLLLLDIEIGSENGIVFSKDLWEKNIIIPTIFITSYPRYAQEAYSAHPFSYISKPVREENLFKTLDDFFKLLAEQIVKPIFFRISQGSISIMPSDIIYFQYLGKKDVIVTTTSEKLTLKHSLGEVEEKVNGLNFFRSHKANLINMDYVKGIENFDIYMTNGVKIPLAQKKRTEFYKYLTERAERKVKIKGLIKQ
jgi:DNA-binding LytR/AlgR family response regulator